MLMSNEGLSSQCALVPEFPLFIDEKIAPSSDKHTSTTPYYLVVEKFQISHQPAKGTVPTDVLHAHQVLEPVYRVIRMKELSEIIGLSRSTIYDRLNPKSKRYDPSFPAPVRLGPSSIGWYLSAVLAWLSVRPEANPMNENKE